MLTFYKWTKRSKHEVIRTNSLIGQFRRLLSCIIRTHLAKSDVDWLKFFCYHGCQMICINISITYTDQISHPEQIARLADGFIRRLMFKIILKSHHLLSESLVAGSLAFVPQTNRGRVCMEVDQDPPPNWFARFHTSPNEPHRPCERATLTEPNRLGVIILGTRLYTSWDMGCINRVNKANQDTFHLFTQKTHSSQLHAAVE